MNGCKASINFISQGRSKLQDRTLWDAHFRNLRWSPTIKKQSWLQEASTAPTSTIKQTISNRSRAYLLMRVEALDHKNSTRRVTIKRWQINVRKLYSNTSKSAHTAVTVARTAAEIFLSLHRRISATAPKSEMQK